MMSEMDSSTFYQNLLENLGAAVIATDGDLNIRTWNAAAARIFGAGAERMIGTPILSIIPQDRRHGAERMLLRSVRTGETYQFEFQHRNAQGMQRELACIIAAVVSDTGDRIGASVCVRDITRRIAMQSELSESRKMVALGEMAGAIAHHFNNILGGVVVSIDYARRSDDLNVMSRVLDQLGAALQRATTLVNGLLAFAEGDQRAGDLCDFTEIMNDVIDEFEQRIQNTGITMTVAMPELPIVPVARLQVANVFRNIIRNAIEAMPDGGKLHIDVSNDDASLVILVEDTGCGLDEAAKSRIFEPFWTTKGVLSPSSGDPATSAEATGLGLAIAHGLVNMMGGTITVTSEVGKGSCFRVTLPISP